jgi:hypothetical protein
MSDTIGHAIFALKKHLTFFIKSLENPIYTNRIASINFTFNFIPDDTVTKVTTDRNGKQSNRQTKIFNTEYYEEKIFEKKVSKTPRVRAPKSETTKATVPKKKLVSSELVRSDEKFNYYNEIYSCEKKKLFHSNVSDETNYWNNFMIMITEFYNQKDPIMQIFDTKIQDFSDIFKIENIKGEKKDIVDSFTQSWDRSTKHLKRKLEDHFSFIKDEKTISDISKKIYSFVVMVACTSVSLKIRLMQGKFIDNYSLTSALLSFGVDYMNITKINNFCLNNKPPKPVTNTTPSQNKVEASNNSNTPTEHIISLGEDQI